MSMKNPMTPSGIEPATFRIVAQHINHCATAVPLSTVIVTMKYTFQNVLEVFLWMENKVIIVYDCRRKSKYF
jgi:hypothetical protein